MTCRFYKLFQAVFIALLMTGASMPPALASSQRLDDACPQLKHALETVPNNFSKDEFTDSFEISGLLVNGRDGLWSPGRLEQFTSDDHVLIYFDSFGGSVKQGYALARAIAQSPATYTALVERAGSSATIALNMVDHIYALENAQLLIHPFKWRFVEEATGKPYELSATEAKQAGRMKDYKRIQTLNKQLKDFYRNTVGLKEVCVTALLTQTGNMPFNARDGLRLGFYDYVIVNNDNALMIRQQDMSNK